MSLHSVNASNGQPAPTLFPMGQVSLNPRKRPSDIPLSTSSSPPTTHVLSSNQAGSGTIKKRRMQKPDEVRPDWVIDKEDSWALDLNKLYTSDCGISRQETGEIVRGQLGDVAGKELRGGLVVLCVLGSTTVHLQALRYELHRFPCQILTRLLHPLGGGREALDAIVVLDTCGRRRMVLPVGWGQSRYCSVSDELLKCTLLKLIANLMDGVRWLDKECREQRESGPEEMEIDMEE
ncbi:MAG: hypothetical protein M1840_005634 [Geoglossum simile]|nr:MAG: hypothetical protein M1840_005634 [Geoglossum simile]